MTPGSARSLNRMAPRAVASGCSAQFVHQAVVPLDTWDDETGATTFA